MRKEIIFAIILGLILGGIILYGLRLANQATKDLTLIQTTPTPESQPTDTEIAPDNKSILTITSPLDNSVSSIDKITLTGSGPANTDLAIIAENYQEFIQTDNQGNFGQEIDLISGENEISVSLVNQNQLETQQITVIYTTAKIDP
jgi:hypothetical protein